MVKITVGANNKLSVTPKKKIGTRLRSSHQANSSKRLVPFLTATNPPPSITKEDLQRFQLPKLNDSQTATLDILLEMEGDLSLSQSLGGLRIANPDDSLARQASCPTDTTPSEVKELEPVTAISTESSTSRELLPEITNDHLDRPLSQINFDPSSYKSEDFIPGSSSPARSDPAAILPRRSSTRRKPVSNGVVSESPNRVPQQTQRYDQGYQQGQGQWQAPAMRQYGSSPMNSPIPAADPSYRLHRESSNSSINGNSRRTPTRASGAAMQAGVPTSEAGYNDRTYRNVQHTSGNAPYPPRRSSKNIPASVGYAVNGQVMGQSFSSPASRSNSDDWQERGAAVAMRPEMDASGRPIVDVNGHPVLKSHKKGVKDFQFGRTLGEGSYSTVLLAKDRQTGHEYAIKVLDKRHIIKEKKVKYVNIEKDTLNRLNDHPGVVRLYYTFQDERSLYFVLDVASGGELLGTLKRMGTFDEDCTKFYGAQVLDTIEYMHSRGVIHRDLKPENILLNDHMHTKITDFGTAKILDPPSRSRANSNVVPLPGDTDQSAGERAVSFVGTAEYVSPELLTEKNAGKPSDLWAFGCILYQLLAGRPPFKAANEYLTFQKIVALDYTYPKGFPPVARDLVERLLVLDPSRRLTIDHVKNHQFFDGIQWGRGLWDQKPPHLKSFSAPTMIQNLNAPSASSTPPEISHSTRPVHISGTSNPKRPSPRLITELPPPSQLDIEWSPILTRNNERILKVGQQIVLQTTASSPNGIKGEKAVGNTFTRFFGGGPNSRKRQRLVMVTSSGRILIAASDGNEKKTKSEISLIQEGCTWKKLQDSKGLSYWVIDTVSSSRLLSPPS